MTTARFLDLPWQPPPAFKAMLAAVARASREHELRKARAVVIRAQALAATEVVEPLDPDEAVVWYLGIGAIAAAGPDERAAMVRASILLSYAYPADQVAEALTAWAEDWPLMVGTAPELDYADEPVL